MMTTNGKYAGQIIELNDSELNFEDIETAIEFYLLNPNLVEEHSLLAMEAAKKFMMKECLQNYEKYFYSILDRN
jgi:hypothetical protein